MFPLLKQYCNDRFFESNFCQNSKSQDNKKSEQKIPLTSDETISSSSQSSAELVTVFGHVTDETNEDLYHVSVSGEEPIVFLRSGIEIRWNLVKNDKVRVTGTRQEEFGTSKQLEVKSIEPKSSKREFGRVTKISDDFIVFEARIILLKSSLPDFTAELELHQECEYEIIETQQKFEGQLFDWRVVEILTIIKPLEAKPLEIEVIKKNIKMRNEFIKIALNVNSSTKYVFIQNDSSETVKLMRCCIEPPMPELVKLIKEKNLDGKVLYHMQPKDKSGFKVSLQVFPQLPGRYEVNLIADFETANGLKIQKRSQVTIEVYEETNLHSGPRIKSTPRFVDIRIKDFLIPDDIRKIDFSKVREILNQLKQNYCFLSEPEIMPFNYIQKLTYAIYLDEVAMEISFKNYHIPKARFENKDDFLRLEVKDVAEKRPSIIMGDFIEVHDPFRNDKEQPFHKGYIHKVEHDAILVKFDERFHLNHRGKEFTVNFFFSRSSYKQQHHAIESVTSDNGLGFDFLFPKIIPSRHLQIHVELRDEKLMMFGKKLKWFDNKLNNCQRAAVVNAMRGECRPMPYIIYGPPGTGKTMTTIELIKQVFTLDPTSQIIVATPSNSAANLFTSALISSSLFQNPLDFVRFVSNNQVEKNLIPDHLQRYCATISISSSSNRKRSEPFEIEGTGLRKNLTKFEIMGYRICIATISCFGSLMQMKFPHDHFSHVIIDEAGQSTEAESLIPISLLSKYKGQVILAGDPLQLGPISNSRYVKNLKLDSSLLERLLTSNHCYTQNASDGDYDPRFVTKLKVNYRSLPSVLKVYNDLFYNGELQGAVDKETSSEAEMLSIILDIENLFPQPTSQTCGVFFVDVHKGDNYSPPDSCSWRNEAEISAIISFLSKLNMAGVEFKHIGVITPYALQVKQFKLKISVCLPDTDLKVGTVEEFQGQERLIILLSTVRTDEKHFNTDKKFGLGFLQCKKRMNVAISRAQSMLVVFGKSEVLKKDEDWAKLIAYTQENGSFTTDSKT